MDAATQQDIDRLRQDIGTKWADMRDALKSLTDIHVRHEADDDRRFAVQTEQISGLKAHQDEARGSLGLIKWLLIGIGAMEAIVHIFEMVKK